MLLRATDRANAEAGGKDYLQPCLVSSSHDLPHLLLVWFNNRVVQELFSQQKLLFYFIYLCIYIVGLVLCCCFFLLKSH